MGIGVDGAPHVPYVACAALASSLDAGVSPELAPLGVIEGPFGTGMSPLRGPVAAPVCHGKPLDHVVVACQVLPVVTVPENGSVG